MSALAMPKDEAGTADVISMSMTAGVEIEKSRLGKRYNRNKIAKFGSMLRGRALLPMSISKSFADPGFVQPIHQLYVRHEGHSEATMEILYDYLDRIAQDFESFDDDTSPEKKRALVTLCSRLHRFLSDEFRSEEDTANYGWRH